MRFTTPLWAAAALALTGPGALAQSDPLGDEFIFFVDGTNVLVPSVDGGTTVDDPYEAGNRVVRFAAGAYTEGGFTWPRTQGVDASQFVGASAGAGDTLYFRLLSDPANASVANVSILLSDATEDDGRDRATVEAAVAGGEDIPDYQMRLIWPIPAELHDGQWHDLAIPLPPATYDALEAAKKSGELADGAELWRYTGAWSQGGFGIGEVAPIDPPTSDPLWVEFGWNQLYRLGPFWDNSTGGGPIFMDDVYIGGPSTNISDATEPPAAMSGVSYSGNGETNQISWSPVEGAGGYNVYASLSPITDVAADDVLLLKRLSFDDPAQFSHRFEVADPSAPVPTVYYAVTSLSLFGVENEDVSMSAGSVQNESVAQAPYILQLTEEEANALFDALEAGTPSDAAFPDRQPSFYLDSGHRTQTEGSEAPSDLDNSASFKIGYSDLQEWFIYGEIRDDQVVFAGEGTPGSEGYLYDSIELGIGHYDVRTTDGGDALVGTPHESMERGDEPDYQIRIGGRQNTAGEVVGAYTYIGNSLETDFENASVVERTDTGWRFLTLLPMDQIQAVGDVLLPVPSADEVQVIPFTIAMNDADGTGQRETQVLLSIKPNVTNQWWNTPAQWEAYALVGRDVNVIRSVDAEAGAEPSRFALGRSAPNPTRDVAQVSFVLGEAERARLEVFNVLGQRVMVAADRAFAAGPNTVELDTRGLAPGVYLYRLTAGDHVATRRMTVAR